MREDNMRRPFSYGELGNVVLYHLVDFVSPQLLLARTNAVRRRSTGLVSFVD